MQTATRLKSQNDETFLKTKAEGLRDYIARQPVAEITDRLGKTPYPKYDKPNVIAHREAQVSSRNQALENLISILDRIKPSDREYVESMLDFVESELDGLYAFIGANPESGAEDRTKKYKTPNGTQTLVIIKQEQLVAYLSKFVLQYAKMLDAVRNLRSESPLKQRDKRGKTELSYAEQGLMPRLSILAPVLPYAQHMAAEPPEPTGFSLVNATKPYNIWLDQMEPSPNDGAAHLAYWQREWWRCGNGIYIGGGQVHIPGWLYFHTTYAKNEIDVEGGGKRTEHLALRDTEWEFEEIKAQARRERKGVITLASRDLGKTVNISSLGAWHYNFFAESEVVYSVGDKKDFTKLTLFTEKILSNLPAPFRFQRQHENDWRKTVRASLKNRDGSKSNTSWDSRFEMRNYDHGTNTMANNGLRPIFHPDEEIGKIENYINCRLASRACWNYEQGALPWAIGTGGDMDKGTDAIRVFQEPDVYRVIPHFIPVTRALHAYKEPQSLHWFLTEKRGMTLKKHPDLARIRILVSNEERCMREFVIPERENAAKSKDPNALTKTKAYYPLTPEEIMVTNLKSPFPVDLLKQQKLFLMQERIHGMPVELYRHEGKVKWRNTDKRPILTYPLPTGADKEGCVMVYELPDEKAEWATYVGGGDPYKQDQAHYSDSLGTMYIHKRAMNPFDGTFQDTLVAHYVGRPATIQEWNATAEMLLDFYDAISNGENEDMGFVNHMITVRKQYRLAEAMDFLKEIVPNTKVQRPYWLTGSEKPKKFCRNELIAYMTETIGTLTDEKTGESRPVFGVSRIPDIGLIEECLHYREGGNYDRIIGYSYGLAYARQYLDRHFKPSPKKDERVTQEITREEYLRIVKAQHMAEAAERQRRKQEQAGQWSGFATRKRKFFTRGR